MGFAVMGFAVSQTAPAPGTGSGFASRILSGWRGRRAEPAQTMANDTPPAAADGVRRRPDGSIDTEHYTAIGRALRAEAMLKGLRATAGRSRPLDGSG